MGPGIETGQFGFGYSYKIMTKGRFINRFYKQKINILNILL